MGQHRTQTGATIASRRRPFGLPDRCALCEWLGKVACALDEQLRRRVDGSSLQRRNADAHELMLANDQSPWIHTNLTSDSGTQTTPTSMLYGCCGNDSIPRAVYLGDDNDIHLFSHQNGGWIDEDLFQNDIVIGAPAGGIASTGWGGLIPYMFQVDGIVQIVYTGADQHIHLLSQILPGAQIRPRRLARIANLRSRLPGTSSDRSRHGGHAGRFQDRDDPVFNGSRKRLS
jgi:hypothetical protein